MNKKKQKQDIIKIIKVLVFTLILTIILIGCSEKEKDAVIKDTGGGELVIAMTNEPTGFDPFMAESADTRSILFNIFEGLVKPNTDGTLIPAVAEDFKTSDDGKMYTFVLRNGIKFHNGNPVTVDDVIYSINQAISMKFTGYDNVASVQATDDKTIEIILSEADNEFLPYLTVAIVPKDYTEQATRPIGTGPYKLESFTEQQSLVLTKNMYYWQEGKPHLDKVIYKSVSDGTSAVFELQSGSVDLLSVEYPVIQQLDVNKFNIVETPSNSVQMLALNNDYEPFRDIRVRQAISYAVDSNEIIKTVNKGYAKRAASPIIPSLTKLYDNSLNAAYETDIEKAKQLMKEAGYENGFSLKITGPSIYQVHMDTAQVIINQLKEIGINASIESVDWSTWLSNTYTNRQYEATVISVDGTNITAKSYLGRYVSTADKNFVNYSSSEYDSVYAAAVTEPNEEKRNNLYKQAQQILSRDAASVYIQDISRIYVLRKGFTGIVNYPLYVIDLSTIRKEK